MNGFCVRRSLNDFKNVCQKYEIKHSINAEDFVNYLKVTDFQNLNNSLIYHYKRSNRDINEELQNRTFDFTEIDKKSMLEKEFIQNSYFFDFDNLKQLTSNFKKTKQSLLSNTTLLPVLYIVLFLVWLFICFEFTSVKKFIITVPIGGVLILLNFMTLIIYHNSKDLILYTFLFTFLLIIGLTIYGFKTKKIRKPILSILVNLVYVIAPIFIGFCVNLYNELTKYKAVIDANGSINHVVENSIFLNQYLIYIYSLLGILIFLPLLRKWKAYAE